MNKNKQFKIKNIIKSVYSNQEILKCFRICSRKWSRGGFGRFNALNKGATIYAEVWEEM
jgi:hypothetical protein